MSFRKLPPTIPAPVVIFLLPSGLHRILIVLILLISSGGCPRGSLTLLGLGLGLLIPSLELFGPWTPHSNNIQETML